MSKSIIIVPYRNRPDHLKHFINRMAIHFNHQHICIVEQSEGKAFNRGKLLNIGYLENRLGYENYVFHDVDMLPAINVDYSQSPFYMTVTQMAASDIQAKDYLGGVTNFNHESFYRSGGYHNDYFHRAEDNEMMFNLKRLGIKVIEKPAKFDLLPHKREGLEFDPALWRKAQKPRKNTDQLKECKYTVTDQKIFGNIMHLIVEI